jgi:hypothetical protein
VSHVPHPAAIERAMSAAMSLIQSLGDDAEDDAIRESALDGETDALEVARRLIRAALDLETMAKAAKSRMDDLAARHDRFAARADSARETAKQMLDALGVSKLTTEDFTVSLRTGPPKVLITDEAQLAEEFWRISRSPDRPLIKAALDAGRPVEGATMSNGSPVLSVRTK